MPEKVFELSWFLTGEQKPYDVQVSPYKAHFCLRLGTEIVARKVFTKDELQKEIKRLRDVGALHIEYEEALREIYSFEQAGSPATVQP